MSEKLEEAIRKSLDAVEKKRKISQWVGIAAVVIGVWFMVTMALFVDERPQTLEKLSFQIMLGFDGLGAIVCAGWAFFAMHLQKNTGRLLQAIEALSNSDSK